MSSLLPRAARCSRAACRHTAGSNGHFWRIWKTVSLQEELVQLASLAQSHAAEAPAPQIKGRDFTVICRKAPYLGEWVAAWSVYGNLKTLLTKVSVPARYPSFFLLVKINALFPVAAERNWNAIVSPKVEEQTFAQNAPRIFDQRFHASWTGMFFPLSMQRLWQILMILRFHHLRPVLHNSVTLILYLSLLILYNIAIRINY